MNLTKNQKRLIEHALGYDRFPDNPTNYRNYYMASPGQDCLSDLEWLEVQGLMTSSAYGQESRVFQVTPAGAAAINKKLSQED